jgi:hypothetical protein
MAEIEVHPASIDHVPVDNCIPGKCYEVVDYTRKQPIRGSHRYFTNLQPQYVGKFIRRTKERLQLPQRNEYGQYSIEYYRYHFTDINNNEISIDNLPNDYDDQETKCFIETECRGWESRKKYLGLLEGTPVNEKDHIQHYLFDDNIIKAVSEHMGGKRRHTLKKRKNGKTRKNKTRKTKTRKNRK